MDDHPASALQYGHLGKGTYSTESQSWTFSRTLSPARSLTYEEVTKTIIEPSLTVPQGSGVDRQSSLIRSNPELAACWPHLRDERLSAMIAATADLCDARISSLLDLGNATDLHDPHGSRGVPIAVFASGECGNYVSFRKIEEETVELRQRGSDKVRVPSIGASETTEWSGSATPIRQICFARTIDETPTWMAARYAHSTFVFRPLYHQSPVPRGVVPDTEAVSLHEVRNSRLDANLIMDIPTSRTGGFSHACVAFNAWYQKQLGIVDDRGNWSIWELSGRLMQTKGNWTAACVQAGSLPWLPSRSSSHPDLEPRYDGWAAIEWAGDVNTFLVSDRRCIMFYRMGEEAKTSPCTVELDLKKSEWILDVQRAPCNASTVFVLTTSRVFLLDVNPTLLWAEENKRQRSLHPRLMWRHFRDAEDTTLRLSSISVGQKGFYLVLYSRLNDFVQALQWNVALETPGVLTCVHDPFTLRVPQTSNEVFGNVDCNRAGSFYHLVFRDLGHSSSLKVGKFHRLNLNLIKAFSIDSRLAVRETIYTSPVDEHDHSVQRDVLRPKHRQAGRDRNQRVVEDDFIVDDWDESVQNSSLLPSQNASRLRPVQRAEQPQWTIDFGPSYSWAIGKQMTAITRRVGHEPEISFSHAIEKLSASAKDTASLDTSTSETLLEIVGTSPALDDIDRNSDEFEHLLAKYGSCFTQLLGDLSSTGRISSSLRVVQDQTANPTELPARLSLVRIYDQLVGDWLSVLPQNVPGRTRVMKEKVIRSLAVELLLSSFRLKSKTAGPLEPPNGEKADNAQGLMVPSLQPVHAGSFLTLPVRPHIEDATTRESRQEPPASNAPVVSQSRGSTPAALDALASFTNLHPQRSVSRKAISVLSHWAVGVDPATYDWQKTMQEQQTETLRSTTPVRTPKRRVRQRFSQGPGIIDPSSNPTSSPGVTVVREWASQPDNEPPRLQIQSSQAAEDDLPMTQLERGTFGGREASKKSISKARKKKRAAGF